VNDDNGFGVPAGWYPDPLGLPQMRWWDNHGWTEHTTEARAPIVIQEAKLAWADDEPEYVDELPTRREMREREQRESGATDHGSVSPGAPNADALLELEPPSWDALPADEPAPEVLLVPQFAPAETAAQQSPIAEPAPQASGTQTAAGTPPGQSRPGQEQITPEAHAKPQAQTAPFAHGSAPSTNTAGGWIIALLPLAQLLGTLLVVSAAGATGTNVGVILAILIAPYFISIPFAINDQRALRRHGYDRPASWAWVFLSGPVYLIARAVRILMRAGNGFTPILVWGALVLLQLGSIVAVPGLVVSALPHVFAEQAAQSVQRAAVFGPRTSVICPAPPATVMGQRFTCTMQRIPSGETFKVTVSLERQNGWIAWVVTDWGTYGVYR
jgi:hypothetical protein